ncbi:hypothetical protein [Caproiciproducens faecalis]|uniref:Uncharacterized protein n=1 Tax=Caproiciproducens faecalis TaxID=2820301 RepID=A0ABS7DRH7_9FIRM|nr:hypothetical protein [Caproiciproducens faecalis]MBW7573913.1 hypothetical protein [Caproiciproducens faecalis]
MIFPHTVTIYNYTKAGYNRTVLRGVLWEDTKAKNVNKTGSTSVDSARVFVPFSVDSGGATYKSPAEYQAYPTGAWTLQIKQKDFIVKGECPFVLVPGGSIAELTTNYDALTITSVTACDFGSAAMHHWEVGGK